jgi:hypothetical protein
MFDSGTELLNAQKALNEAYFRKNIVARIGGDEFTNGRLKSFSFKDSSLTSSLEVTIVIEESKRLNSYLGNIYASNIASPQWLDSFQETFSFSRNEEKYSFSRNVSIAYKQDAGSQFLSNAAYFIKSFYFNNRPNLGRSVDGISEQGRFNSNFRTLITEEIDLISLKVSLTENFESSFIQNGVSKKTTYSESLDANGYQSLEYNIEIKALTEPLEYNASIATKDTIDSIVSQHSAAYGTPILIEKGLDKDGGVVSLRIGFTNDPSKSSKDFVSYVLNINKAGGFQEYQLSINYSSDGKDFESRFSNVKILFAANSSPTYLKAKISSVFLIPVSNIYEKSRSVTYTKHEGKISASFVFSDDSAYNVSGGFLKVKNISSNSKSAIIERLIDLSDKNEKINATSKFYNYNNTQTTIVTCPQSSGFFFGYNSLLSPSISDFKSNQITIDSENSTTTRVLTYSTTS